MKGERIALAELPELTILQQQMHMALTGRVVQSVEIRQEKCLNTTVPEAIGLLTGRRITDVTRRGKWLLLHLDPAYFLLLNLGMGADLWHYPAGGAPNGKYQFRLELDDGSGLTCRFWWFGYIRLVAPADLPDFKEIAALGPSPLAISADEFTAIARRYPRSPVKALVLDQEKVSGIGNAYAHDILWEAGLHPQQKIGSLTDDQLHRLLAAMRTVLTRAIELGGLEPDFYNRGGNMGNAEAFFRVGYREGRPCPRCGTAVTKIKTGATSTFICPTCQK